MRAVIMNHCFDSEKVKSAPVLHSASQGACDLCTTLKGEFRVPYLKCFIVQRVAPIDEILRVMTISKNQKRLKSFFSRGENG